jgi:hypothetical protein
MSRPRLALAIEAMAAAFIVAGCSLLFPELAAPFDPNLLSPDPYYGLPVPTVQATYTSGLAEVTIKQGTTAEVIELNQVASGSQLTSDLTAHVTWRNSDGWTLVIDAYDMAGLGVPMPGLLPQATLTLERVVDGQFWVAPDTDSVSYELLCQTSVKEMSTTVVRGAAICSGMRWEDGSNYMAYGDPMYIGGQGPFGLSLTFEADGSAELPRVKN